ncbi:kinase-like domain-containing protein [Hyaloraphidium curvatum]|nr:kinase-like domain-containing protein [Hyaloraphidium curvatum]
MSRGPGSGRAPRRWPFDSVALLGSGTQGTVKLARHRGTGAKAAVKSCPKPRTADKKAFAAALEAVLAEVRSLALAGAGGGRHTPALLDFGETSSHWLIAMEHIAGPNLQELLQRKPGARLPEKDAAAVVSGVLHALVHLHANGIVHRDLKPANIVLRDAEDPGSVVLVDFGSAFAAADSADVNLPDPMAAKACGRSTSSSSFESMLTIRGTPYYLPPEIVKGLGYNSRVDMWSLGCIAFQLLCGASPFEGSASFARLYERILDGDFSFPEGCTASPQARDFVGSLLRPEAAERPTAGAALAHPWIAPLHAARSGDIQAARGESGMLVAFTADLGLQVGGFSAVGNRAKSGTMVSFTVDGALEPMLRPPMDGDSMDLPPDGLDIFGPMITAMNWEVIKSTSTLH